MRVVVYGSTGRTGSRVRQELERRGHQVFAITRDGQEGPSSANTTWKVDDLSNTERIAETILGTDVVVSAYAPPAGSAEALVGVCRRLAEAVRRSGVTRLLVVGGAGVLQIESGMTLLESGRLPPDWVPLAAAHTKALAALTDTAIDWVYLAPAALFEPGERRGSYRLGTNKLITDDKGESRISMEDYAIAVVDELEKPKHHQCCFTVAW